MSAVNTFSISSTSFPSLSVTYPRIICVGDSITQQGTNEDSGWFNALAAAYIRKADIVNRGFSGYNTRWVKHVVPTLFTDPLATVLLVTIFLGANDAVFEGFNEQGVPLEEFKGNLKEMVRTVRALSTASTKILLITPPPVYERADRSFENTRRYRDGVLEVGNEEGLAVLDTFEVFNAATAKPSELYSDGLHFSPLGNRVFSEALLAKIETTFPELSLTRLPTSPWALWGDIRNDALPESLISKEDKELF